MRTLSDDEIENLWECGMSLKELIQKVFEYGAVYGHNSQFSQPSKTISMLEKIIKRKEKSYG